MKINLSHLHISAMILLGFALHSCSSSDNDQSTTPQDQLFEDRLLTLVPLTLNNFDVNGMAVAYINSGDVLLKTGFGLADVASNTAITPNTIFNVGSVSKMFTGYGAMNLVRQGKIDLDSPIESYLSTWQLPPSEFNHSKVTLGRLMRHRGGTSVIGYPGYPFGQPKPTLIESLSGLGSQGEAVQIIYDPGSDTQYSGGGISIMQLAIEEVGEMPFANFMQSNIFNRFGMTSTGFEYTNSVFNQIATPYNREKIEVGHTDFTALGAAGMLSNLNDLVDFSLAIINIYNESISGAPGVDLETLNKIRNSAINGTLQWEVAHQVRGVNGVVLIGHIGTNPGWRTTLHIAPREGHALITMANGPSGGPDNQIICEWIREITGVSLAEFCN